MRGVAGAVGAATVGYLLGSIPSADIVARRSGTGVDLHSAGSGNPGALNTTQVLGAKWGAVVLVADVTKGALAGLAGRALGRSPGAYIAATAAVAGHIVPVWSGGRGGKGVATSAGTTLTVFPAWFPADLAVVGTTAATKHDAERTMQVLSAVRVVAAIVWWRRRMSNGWGPKVTLALPLYALATGAMIVAKFRLARPSVAS
jgi:glycerol-3-phosphate acyltransferase PlsY